MSAYDTMSSSVSGSVMEESTTAFWSLAAISVRSPFMRWGVAASPSLSVSSRTYAEFLLSNLVLISMAPLPSRRTHWNFMSETRMVLDQPSVSKEFFIFVSSEASSEFCCKRTFGRLNRIFIPGLAFHGHWTCTRTPPASRAKGLPGLTPLGTTTSNSCMVSSLIFLPVPAFLSAAGGRILTTDPGSAASGTVTTSCMPRMTMGIL
mmetsp:Transcript_7396/g.17594  ORF Transcript_7396/g.17594 Transcript_7396/m.17594 type:complete len:206 (-) Transcript_7396:386-1003(-)